MPVPQAPRQAAPRGGPEGTKRSPPLLPHTLPRRTRPVECPFLRRRDKRRPGEVRRGPTVPSVLSPHAKRARAPRRVQMRGDEERPTEAWAAHAAGRAPRVNEADAPLSALGVGVGPDDDDE